MWWSIGIEDREVMAQLRASIFTPERKMECIVPPEDYLYRVRIISNAGGEGSILKISVWNIDMLGYIKGHFSIITYQERISRNILYRRYYRKLHSVNLDTLWIKNTSPTSTKKTSEAVILWEMSSFYWSLIHRMNFRIDYII